MNWSKLYYDFAAAYGTFWLILFVLAVLTQSHIDAGVFGVAGFPIIAALYAFFRQGAIQGTIDSVEEERRKVELYRQEELQQLENRLARLENRD